MDLRQLTLEELKDIYVPCLTRDFPANELMPLSRMEDLTRRGAQRTYGLYEGDELCAYGVFILGDNTCAALLNYFAVEPQFRGKGVGTKVLEMLCGAQGLFAEYILFEVEAPRFSRDQQELELRQRRIRFYLHCGARRTAVDSRLFGVDYQIMFLPRTDYIPEDEEVRREMENLYRIVVSDEENFSGVCEVSITPKEEGRFSRELGRALSFLTRSRKRFMGERLKEYDFAGGMYIILLHVDRHPGTSQDSIAGHMYIDKCTVARRTKKLEELGYLYRETDKNDRRQNKLYLTEKGVLLAPVIREYLSQWGDEATEKLTDEEKKTLLYLLTKMTGH